MNTTFRKVRPKLKKTTRVTADDQNLEAKKRIGSPIPMRNNFLDFSGWDYVWCGLATDNDDLFNDVYLRKKPQMVEKILFCLRALSFLRSVKLVIFQLRTTKHLWTVTSENAKWWDALKVKIEARKYKRCLIISKENPQRLFQYFFHVMTSALYRTVPPVNPCMLCDLN